MINGLITICECPADAIRHIAESNRCRLSQCRHCGTFWVQTEMDPNSRPADGAESALAEIIVALARGRAPVGAVAGYRERRYHRA